MNNTILGVCVGGGGVWKKKCFDFLQKIYLFNIIIILKCLFIILKRLIDILS
jgi:hypothetical protein